MPLRVLHLRDTNRICGPGKTILETCTRIDRSRFELRIGLFLRHGEERNHPYLEAARARGIETIPLYARHSLDPGIVRRLLEVVDAYGIDLVHAHEYKSDILSNALSRLRSVPVITTAHGWIRNSRRSRALVWLSQRAMRRFDRVIAVSPRIRDELVASGLSRERVSLIYNAIVREDYRPENIQRGLLRQRCAVPENVRLVGMIGRLSPEKGQRVFLEAAARLAASFPGVRFVLAGEGPSQAELESLARDLGIADRVVFAGYWDDVRPVFRDLDIVALTSYTEGFPNVLLEALCMGCPVVATDVGGVPDIVHDGDTGYLVQAGDAGAVADRLHRLLDAPDSGDRMVNRGRELVDARFTFEQRVTRIESLYDEVAKRHGIGSYAGAAP